MAKKWSRYLIHPLTVSFVLSILVIFILARYLPQYYTELVEEKSLTNNGEVYYFDLDNDGNSEKLDYYQYNRIFQPTLYLYNSDGNFTSLWNFLESPVQNSKIFAGDYDNDNVKELFVFTENTDSLFLYILNTENDKENVINRAFIAKGKFEDAQVIPIGLYNFNNENAKDFLFALNTENGNPVQKVFLFDIKNKSLTASPELNTRITNPIIVEDINSDNKPEIILSSSSEDVEAGGYESRLIALNNQLNYQFQPIVFHGSASQITANVIVINEQKLIAVLNSGKSSENIYNNLMLYNSKGEQIKESTIKNKSNLKLANVTDAESIYLYSGTRLFKYNGNLKKEKSYKIGKGGKFEFVEDIDILGDSIKEIIFKNNDELIVYSNNLRSKLNLKTAARGRVILTLARNKENPDKISVQVGDKWYLYNYYKNESFFYSHIFYFLLFITITLIVLAVYKLRFVDFKKVFKGQTESEFLEEIEDNIEEKFTGLKSKIKALSKEFKNNDSYSKILKEIDETMKEVKTISKTKSGTKSLKANLKNVISKKHNSEHINLHLYPELDFYNVKQEIQDAILTFTDRCLDILNQKANDNLIETQIVLHKDYINLLIEIEDVIINDQEIESNKELTSALDKVNGKIEVDQYSNTGTIVSVYFPLLPNKVNTENKKERIKVIIAEDHDVSLFGLTSLFKTKEDIELVGTAKNGMEVLQMLESKKTDIVITDISMPGMDGIELSEQLKNNYPGIKVIVFTMYLENWFIEQLVNNGAKGFVSKNSKIVELISAVRNVYEGKNYYCPQFKSKFGFKADNNGIKKNLDSLTKKELQIIKHYADNYTKDQIAVQMKMNTKTMDNFVANILLKLNAGDEDEIIRIAKKQKFISE